MLSLETRSWRCPLAQGLFHRFAILAGVLLLPVMVTLDNSVMAQTRSLTSTYTENFDNLANTGSPVWTNDSTLDGWQAFRANGGPLFTTYSANTGSGTTGALYSYGSSAATDRALGSLASSSTGAITLGVAFTNNTGSTLQLLHINYTGEQWRSGSATSDGYVFEYQIGVSSADAGGTWIAVTQLDFVAPQNTNAGVMDGNLAANRLGLSFTLTNLNIPNGTDFCLRWRDSDASGSDHGVGLDDFSIGFSPTAITLISFDATTYADGVMLEWKTGYEVNNLGFRIWREEGNKRTLVNRQLIAGSALTSGTHSVLQSGEAYSWWDTLEARAAAYWLEDIDLDGSSTWHGPFYASLAKHAGEGLPRKPQPGRTLSQIAGKLSELDTSHVVESRATSHGSFNTTAFGKQMANLEWPTALAGSGAGLESQPAIKLSVKREGFYRVAATQLFAAGLSRHADPGRLQLITGGREIPMALADVNGRLTENSYIEFYGLGLDTPSTDTRIYWLIEGKQPGRRLAKAMPSGLASPAPSFTQTVERRDRTIYFSGLANGDEENFFGDIILSQPLDQRLSLPNLYQAATQPATLDITLQGVTKQAHRVAVYLNHNAVGFIDFSGQNQGTGRFTIPHAVLLDGLNTVRLTAQGGANDLSLVDHIRISYQHKFAADNNALKFSAPAGQQLTITGFTTGNIRAFDITNADEPVELLGRVQTAGAGFAVTLAARGGGIRNLLALAAEQTQAVAGLKVNQPSALKQATGADFVIISPRTFFSAIDPLTQARSQNGYQVIVADIEDIYDEFNFGNKSFAAIRDFLAFAKTNWRTSPRFVLLVGDATYDPRGYLGAGEFDLVPTKFVNTALMETASDDWFSDFNHDAIADLPTGRLPVRTKEEADLLIGKLLRTEPAPVPAKVLLVSDQNDGYNFEAASAQVRLILQADFQVAEVQRGQVGTETAKTQLLEALQEGQRLVNYFGHASVGLWRGNLLTANEAQALHNDRLPWFIVMACLNGYYVDVAGESLAESLLKAAAGGAVGVWASSGLCPPEQQAQMNRELYQVITEGNLTMGEATRRAKLAITDRDIRKTWMLFGDPTMKVK